MPRSVRPLLASLGACTAVALLLAAGPLAAQTVYTWKDAKGVTHYSDSPPPKGEYSDRQVKAPAPATPAAPAATASTPAPATPAAAATAQNDRPPMTDDAICTQARQNLANLAGDAPVGPDADGDGKPDSTLGAEDRAKQRELAQAAIAANCTAG